VSEEANASETSTDKKKRIHVLVFESDWEWLGRTYGNDGVKRSNVMRGLLRDFRLRVKDKVEQML